MIVCHTFTVPQIRRRLSASLRVLSSSPAEYVSMSPEGKPVEDRQLDLDVFRFVISWSRISEIGGCDAINSVEYRRVLREWISGGRVFNADSFIAAHAKIRPV